MKNFINNKNGKYRFLKFSVIIILLIIISVFFACKHTPEPVTKPTFDPLDGTYTSIQIVTIFCATEGAIIRYTTDNSIPTNEVGIIYSTPIEISKSTTLKAIAYKEDMVNSEVASAFYIINLPQVGTPVFTPVGGTYTEEQSVAINTATTGAEIRYTIGDGTQEAPTSTTGEVYSTPIEISEISTIKAIAYKGGMADSEVTMANYTIKVNTPTLSPIGGTYTEEQSVAINTATTGAEIRYTIGDGTQEAPTSTTGEVYSTPIEITTTSTIKAIAYKSGSANSEIVSSSYIMNFPQVENPIFAPSGGEYSSVQSVAISCNTPGSEIRYTIGNGTQEDPTSISGNVYSEAISISSTTTIKAIAYKNNRPDSQVITATYTINIPPDQVQAPILEPRGGDYLLLTEGISIFSNTSGATIRYTAGDGTQAPPTSTTGNIYTVPIDFKRGTIVIKAIAYKSGMIDSFVTTVTYNIGNLYFIQPESNNFITENRQPTWQWSTVAGAVIYLYYFNGKDYETTQTSFTPPKKLSIGKYSLEVLAGDGRGNWIDTEPYAYNIVINPTQETIDFGSYQKDVGSHTSIAIDSNNKMHISYYDETDSDLKYATNVSGSWVCSTIDSGGNVGGFSSIDTDSNNKAHISYYDATNDGLKYATNASGTWNITTVDATGYVGRYTSIAIDSNNKAHISYYDFVNGDLRYATNASGSWAYSPIDTQYDVGRYTSIAIDSNNRPHICYSTSSQVLKYIRKTAIGSWDKDYVDNTEDIGYYTSIMLDSNNKAHISYYSITDSGLKYATNASGSWVLANLDTAGDMGRSNSIALSSTGKIHICYYDNTNKDLKYVTNASGSWVYNTLDATGDMGAFTSIKLDSGNKVHISYYDVTNGDLKYATNASGSWVYTIINGNEILDSRVGTYNSIVADSNGKTYISYYDSTIGNLKCATNASGSWASSTVDATGDVGKYSSIAMDSNNKIHISYYDNTNKDLKYATNRSGNGVCTNLDATGDVGQYTSIAIDSNDKIHISYYDNTNKDLKYATNASGSWVYSTVDATGDVGQYTSIAIDSNNKVHISYYDNTNKDLKYTTNKSGTWVYSTVDATGDVGMYSSIAMDVRNVIYISYRDNTNDSLKYARSGTGTTWSKETVSNFAGMYSSIAVDSSSYVHICSCTTTKAGEFLMYATNVSGIWATTSFGSISSSNSYSSIFIDNNDNIYVSYYGYFMDGHLVYFQF